MKRPPLTDAERQARKRWFEQRGLKLFPMPLPEVATIEALIDTEWLKIEESTDRRAIREALEDCEAELIIRPKKSVTT